MLPEAHNPDDKITSIKEHRLLFTGHMIDKPGRPKPRFPDRVSDQVKAAIRKAVLEEKSRIGDRLVGMAGGACGGDILFHEVCGELGIPSELYLALPRGQFVAKSVQFAGVVWVERFDRLYNKLESQVLSSRETLPNPLEKTAGSIWERNNRWMLNQALSNGSPCMTLIALWDGQGGDGPGGTGHMVKQAKDRGVRTVIIDLKGQLC